MKFTYGSGQKPLDGYTIKRGVGRGGFGEVYYGVSDGGKEVALKLIRSNLEVELRGISQCLNLKHPNLVNLYDLRIVPRALKPGNVFIEGGSVKVGDYGLAKFISDSRRTAQTQSVGTVHYMAPEISTGNYNKQIDIYAAGVILYEMLTGRVPFEGESAGEILMKHLTTPPDLTKLPPAFIPLVGRALAKNPAHRYASMAEMALAVESVGPPAAKAAFKAAPPPKA